MSAPRPTLAVVGAGPKAMAIAAKAEVLGRLGFQVPEIVIVERNGVASHWDGLHGFTNGRQSLGTSPEKDVGFPYFSHCWGERSNAAVDAAMLDYSWQRFLVEERHYSHWIDRGRPHPEHRRWGEYLRWVHAKVGGRIRTVRGEVSSLELRGDRWLVDAGSERFEADGVVATGPGRLRTHENLPDDPRIQTLETFWKNLDLVHQIPADSHIAVVGAGETAASMVLYLGHLRADITIDLIVPTAMSYSRGESYVENHVYTDPFQSNWMAWTKEDRLNFIQRTDRGVFSIFAKRCLDQWEFVEIIPGWFRSLEVNKGNQLVLGIEYNGDHESRVYDFVALSLGADPWAQVRGWLGETTGTAVRERLGGEDLSPAWIESNIAEDLSLRGLTPRLHLPMLAGLEQGPGFANLSCLGRVSDQILQSYVALN